LLAGPPNVIRLMFHPDGVRRCVANWEAVAGSLLQRMHREAVGGVFDNDMRVLFDEALALAGVPARPCYPGAVWLAMVRYRIGDIRKIDMPNAAYTGSVLSVIVFVFSCFRAWLLV
jgi:hypothetical protein